MAASLPMPVRRADFFDALRARVDGDVRTEAMDRALYATDASMYEIEPVGVLLPRSAADVQAALETASAYGVPILARGGGSSLAGQAVGRALVLDFTRYMDGILEVDPEARTVRVEPGVVLDDLNAAAAPHGLMVGPDPASSSRATLGGMLANNSTGTHSILYGNMIHHVRVVEGFLADGTPFRFEPMSDEAWQRAAQAGGRVGALYRDLDALVAEHAEVLRRDTPRHWRRSSGYRLEHLLPEGPPNDASPVRDFGTLPAMQGRSLARLLCGSEGTLAVVTEMTVDLVDRPAHTGLGIAHFATRGEALRAVTTVLETGPSAVELFDGVAIERCRQTPGFAQRLTFVEGDPGGVLLTEYFGESPEAVSAQIDRLEDTLEAAGRGYAVVRATSTQRIADVWTVRKEGLGLIMGVKGERKPWAFIEDAAVPVEHLPEYVDELAHLLDATDTKAVFYAHASGGCLHIRPFVDTKDAREVETMRAIAEASAELVAGFGGAVSSEHGDGLARSAVGARVLGPELMALYGRVKQLFDPQGLLNPGKIVDAPPMDHDLRMGPDYATLPVLTEMDFSAEGGFEGAVELCNGNGACRKLRSGTMCPSFMATREEEHSTRGRANALRTAMAGAQPSGAFTSERMYDVMDLCIQCKACKTECPSGVDMAKIKTEWLDKYWREHRMPLRTRLFAQLPRVTRHVAGTWMAGVANWINGTGMVRTLMDWTLGVGKERKLPAFATETLRQQVGEGAGDGPRVVLFADTFTDGYVPEVGRAAMRVLRAAGLRVEIPAAEVCCGRTLLSKGLVSEAQVQALRTLEALYPYAVQGVPIVGLEPSCILTLADEFLALLPGDPRVERLAEHVLLFEDFIDQLAREGMMDDVAWTTDARRVLLHGHCHQKALVGIEAARRVLSLPPGYEVETVDAGCCGMAGAFGYEKEHVAISKRMAERRLAPAVRALPEDALVAAAGFSCRSQIADTTGREALHPAQILAAALREVPAAATKGRAAHQAEPDAAAH